MSELAVILCVLCHVQECLSYCPLVTSYISAYCTIFQMQKLRKQDSDNLLVIKNTSLQNQQKQNVMFIPK
jgi:hypothetical protein